MIAQAKDIEISADEKTGNYHNSDSINLTADQILDSKCKKVRLFVVSIFFLPNKYTFEQFEYFHPHASPLILAVNDYLLLMKLAEAHCTIWTKAGIAITVRNLFDQDYERSGPLDS